MSELRKMTANRLVKDYLGEEDVYFADDVDNRIGELKQRIKELADNLEEAEDLHAEWKNEVAPKISELKQRNKDLKQALENMVNYYIESTDPRDRGLEFPYLQQQAEQLLKGGE